MKDKHRANWMANNNVSFYEMEISQVTRQTAEKRMGAKPLCFKLNANSLITKLAEQSGSAPATPPNPLQLGLCT